MDTFNKHMVGVSGDGIMIMMPPRGAMTMEEALVLAAWLVTLADPLQDEFPRVLEAVQST